MRKVGAASAEMTLSTIGYVESLFIIYYCISKKIFIETFYQYSDPTNMNKMLKL